eukprot:gene4144-4393_t
MSAGQILPWLQLLTSFHALGSTCKLTKSSGRQEEAAAPHQAEGVITGDDRQPAAVIAAVEVLEKRQRVPHRSADLDLSSSSSIDTDLAAMSAVLSSYSLEGMGREGGTVEWLKALVAGKVDPKEQ